MSFLFPAAGQGLNNANPPPFLTGAVVYPFTVGLWSYLTVDPATGMAWSIGAPAQARDALSVGAVSSVYVVNADNGTQFQSVSSPLATTLNRWIFLLGRFISTANRWIVTLDSRGAITQTQGTTSVPLATAFTTIRIGQRADATAQSFAPCRLAEIWYTNTDIGAGTGANNALDASLIRNLAYVGPFSVPQVSANVIDYLAGLGDMRAQTTNPAPTMRDQYFSRYAASNFVYGHDSTPGPNSFHPPLASNYALPPGVGRRIPIQFTAPGVGSAAVFRRTLSPLGARVGSRQIQGYMNG